MSQKRFKNNYLKKDDIVSTSSNSQEDKKIRQTLISNLFPSRVGESSKTTKSASISKIQPNENSSAYHKTISGVDVVLPVKPYKCQMVVMSKVIKVLNDSENCLLESPTGTGKTLALLCSALAWQKREAERLRKCVTDTQLKTIEDAVNIISPKENTELLDMIFTKPVHGEKSIYDEPTIDLEECNVTLGKKRKETLDDSTESDSLVGINKKRRIHASKSSTNDQLDTLCPKEQLSTSDKDITQKPVDDEKLLENLQVQVSMLVNCSLPIIYYGARTHKQLEQVVQEFSRTQYAGMSLMTILASREHSCIKEFDRNRWPSKNDMCRGCTKTQNSSQSETKCTYYDNHRALNHNTLPRAFNLEKLVSEGKRKTACPYYAARKMASVAHIVFCPYSYLIEPAIRKSMQIDLEKNIVIIDEGHNIEDICREAATYTFTQTQIQDALKELRAASGFRFANGGSIDYIAYLNKALEEWSLWFENQIPLIDKQPVNNNAAEYAWDVRHFVDSLNNHNIGQRDYPEFNKNAKMFCKKFRDDPRLLVGITQSTNTVIENLDTVLGYLFRNSGACMDDYKPILVRKFQSNLPDNIWSKSNFEQKARSECLSLSLWCLNPAVLFASLLTARCVLLASGTLTPMASLHSELGTSFPCTASPGHVIKRDRVWVGTLKTGSKGQLLQCDRNGTSCVDVQDSLGEAVRGVCDVTPHGVLCFLPSYRLMNQLVKRWRSTNTWKDLKKIKHVFMESNKMEDHIDIMKQFDECVGSSRGALLLAVYRGKVAEGMDFKDHQARAVIAIGIPYPGKDTAVQEKMKYNDKYSKDRNLLKGHEWFRMQAYRALNQAVGRVVRHADDWGAVLLLDSRYQQPANCEHLSKWVREFLGQNHHDSDSLFMSKTGLKEFMIRMKNQER